MVRRLREEHKVVHALLVQLNDEAVRLIDEPSDSQFERTVAAHEKLEKLLLSHFGYEEDEVGPAMGYYNLAV